MAKQSGLGDNAYIGGYDLSGDICALSRIGGGPAAMDVTAINVSAYERIGGLRDGEISFQTWFNPTAQAAAVNISDSSVANPTVITTAAAHGLATGDYTTISGHTGSTPDLNGPHRVTVLTTTTFTIPVNVTVSGNADGTSTRMSQEHAALKGLPTADVQVMYFRGTTLGNPAAAMVAKQINYDPTRNADGSLQFAVQALANAYGLEWCRSLTAGQRTDIAATNGDGVDDGASSSYGLQAYLQVFFFDGTDVTMKLQESSDNGSADAYADVTGGGFTQVTSAPTTERIATGSALAVEQWLRLVTTGTFTTVVFAVAYNRNKATPVF